MITRVVHFMMLSLMFATGRPADPNHQVQLDRVISLLDCLQAQSSPTVKAALAAFAADLSVTTEVRRLLFFLGKLDQLQ